MKIELQPEQFKKLLHLMNLGDFVLNAERNESELDYEKMERAVYRQYISQLYQIPSAKLSTRRVSAEREKLLCDTDEILIDYEEAVYYHALAHRLMQNEAVGYCADDENASMKALLANAEIECNYFQRLQNEGDGFVEIKVLH